MSCRKSDKTKYLNRPGPPYPAQDCQNLSKVGNDGLKYISKPDKNGTYKWVKLEGYEKKPTKASRKSSKKSTRKRSKKSARKSTRKSSKKSTRKSSKKSARKSTRKSSRKSTRKSSKKSTRKSSKKSARKSSKKSARKSTRKSSKKSTRKSSKKSARKSSRKSSRKSTRKSSRKLTRKSSKNMKFYESQIFYYEKPKFKKTNYGELHKLIEIYKDEYGKGNVLYMTTVIIKSDTLNNAKKYLKSAGKIESFEVKEMK